MREVSVESAAETLDELVMIAAAGETVTITRGATPVAVLMGFEEWERFSEFKSFGNTPFNING